MRLESFFLLLPSFVLALGLNACDSGKEVSEKQISNDEPVIVTDSSDNKKAESIEEVEDKASKTNKEYKEIDFNAYGDINWIKYYLLANTSIEMSDEKIVGFISSEYNGEKDAFKKKDMFNELLPKIKNEIEKHRNVVYLAKFPIRPIGDQDFVDEQKSNNKNTLVVKPPELVRYNFENSGFRLRCFHGIYEAANKEPVSYLPLKVPINEAVNCETKDGDKEYVVVKNENVARKLESAIVSNSLDYRGEAYYRMEVTDKFFNTPESRFIPVEMDVTYIDKNTGEELLSEEYTFSFDNRIF